MSRRVSLLVLALLLVVPFTPPAGASSTGLTTADRDTLREYAAATWRSFEAMVDSDTGLPTDRLYADGGTDVQTSTSNIGVYLWSTVAARDLGIISASDARERVAAVLDTLELMERHAASGQFYNWYDHHTGDALRVWPPTGAVVVPRLSSVDNGWLAAGLRVVAAAIPQVAVKARALYDSMDFSIYYREDVNRILFHIEVEGDEPRSPCCYDTLVSESRIATYLGIANGQIPPRAYFGTWRTFPATCDWSFQETRPEGWTHTYLGVDVFEGHYNYRGIRLVPSWGGSMFEALMPSLVVPEAQWAPSSWRVNHPRTVAAQIEHGMSEAQYGYWGWSPADAALPGGGHVYTAMGVDGAGMDPNGYPSNLDRTLVDYGFAGCPGRSPQPVPPPSAFTNGVVTAHAVFLALPFAPGAAMDNLANLRADFDSFYTTNWGFYDSVNVDTGDVTGTYLSLDQGMIMAAIANAVLGDRMHDYFVDVQLERALRPVMARERFSVGHQ
jgi:hypothetical protein